MVAFLRYTAMTAVALCACSTSDYTYVPDTDAGASGGAGGAATTASTGSASGGCASDCAVAHGTGACIGGTCTIGSCEAGFADCDGDAADGCETGLTTLTHCGGCNTPCALANATASCATGTCAVAMCNAGFGECDNNPADGCEPIASTLSATMLTSPPGWTFNGNAHWDAASLTAVLTANTSGQQGTLFYDNPIVTDDFTLSFEFLIGGGAAGDGIIFMLQTDGKTAMGVGGGGLSATGLHGFGFELDTYDDGSCGDTAADHAAVDNLSGCNPLPQMLAVSGTLNLRGAWHTCTVAVASGAATMSIDGSPVIASFAIPGWASGTPYYYGFGSANGAASDRHEIRNVNLTFPTARCL